MAAHDLKEGQAIDGFRLDGALDPGGMANFWRVSRTNVETTGADQTFPMVMKVPLLRRGEDPITIVAFVIGARGSSTLRRYLGSVSARVVAEVPCTVTVVRLPHQGNRFAAT